MHRSSWSSDNSRKCSECGEQLIFVETIPSQNYKKDELIKRQKRWADYNKQNQEEEKYISGQAFMLNPMPRKKYRVLCKECTDPSRSYLPLSWGNKIRECLDCGKQFDGSFG